MTPSRPNKRNGPQRKEHVETPKEFSARRVRVALERAKAAVMDAQEELSQFRGNPTAYQQLTDAALRKLDAAWLMAAQRERQHAPAPMGFREEGS